jgi:hypothetical protein
MLELTAPELPLPRPSRKRQQRDPEPHFQPDRSHQLDAVLGCPALSVPHDHLAWAVLEIVEPLDTTAVESRYSSLGRRGYHPESTLAVWVYAAGAVVAEILLKVLAYNVGRLIQVRRLRLVFFGRRAILINRVSARAPRPGAP